MAKGSGRVKFEASPYQFSVLIFCREGLHIVAFWTSKFSTSIAAVASYRRNAYTPIYSVEKGKAGPFLALPFLFPL